MGFGDRSDRRMAAASAPLDARLLDCEALAPALRSFGESTMLPAAAYTSPDVLAWERRHLFAGTWTCIGRDVDLTEGGLRQRAVVVGDVPVLVLWTDDEPPRAFANTCRHRGHELLAAGGSSANRSVVCPYHAWSYTLDGSLRTAPGFREVATFDPDEHSLPWDRSEVDPGQWLSNVPRRCPFDQGATNCRGRGSRVSAN